MTADFVGPVDLDNCDREPIHIPGSIQPHGALLAVDETTGLVVVASANAAAVLALAGEPLGSHIDDIVRADVWSSIQQSLHASPAWRHELTITARDTNVDVSVHRIDGMVVFEFEPSDAAPPPVDFDTAILSPFAVELGALRSEIDIARRTVDLVRQLTGFDRVMWYRFDHEWNGEVIAEAARDDLNSFLGLNYPASDIPAQARALYKTNWRRLIADTSYVPVPLVSSEAAGDRPLDLSHSMLRSVSPIHIEYLHNMGVTASMSISVLVAGELHALIACHHYDGPWRPARTARRTVDHLAQLTSSRVRDVQELEQRTGRSRFLERSAPLVEDLSSAGSDESLWEVWARHEHVVLDEVGADGVVVALGSRHVRIGRCPSTAVVDKLVSSFGSEHLIVSDAAATFAPSLAREGFGGLVGVRLDAGRGSAHVAWFRDEWVRTVEWGGDPANSKIASMEGDHVRLSPRKSFEKWRATVRHRSRPWSDVEVDHCRALAGAVERAILRRNGAAAHLAADLQQALLPATLPSVAGLPLHAISVADGEGRIGGDWYDAFVLDDGVLGVMVGDVAGHGVEAAAVMAQARNALRAHLLHERDPAVALQRLSRLFDLLLPGEYASAVIAVVDVVGQRVKFASAGHLPPVLLHGGVAELVDIRGGALLGTGVDQYAVRAARFEAGDRLYLFTDGLVEARHRSLDDGLEKVQRTVESLATTDIHRTPEQLLRAMTPDRRLDDVTVLVVGREDGDEE